MKKLLLLIALTTSVFAQTRNVKYDFSGGSAGDILYYDGSSIQLSALGAGTDGHALTLSGGVPAWQAVGDFFADGSVPMTGQLQINTLSAGTPQLRIWNTGEASYFGWEQDSNGTLLLRTHLPSTDAVNHQYLNIGLFGGDPAVVVGNQGLGYYTTLHLIGDSTATALTPVGLYFDNAANDIGVQDSEVLSVGHGGQPNGGTFTERWRMETTGIVNFLEGYGGTELSSDPGNPPEGEHVIWQSNGAGTGGDGDIMIKITAGGLTKTFTLVNFTP